VIPAVDRCAHRHSEFVDEQDLPQRLYEKARKGALDRRVRVGEPLLGVLRTQGVPGIFDDPRGILACSCQARERSRRDAAFHHSHLPEQVFEMIARSLAEGVGVATTARIQGVDKKTVLHVLAKAAEQATKVSGALLKNLVVSECQLDEMWSFVGKKEKNLDALEKTQAVLGDAWIWVAFDAVNKIFLAIVVGKRTMQHAVALLREVEQVTARMPALFSSDQLDHYANALLQVYGKLVYPPRKPGPGRPPNPRLVPPDDLLYVHVVKQYQGYRVVKVTRKVIFGDPTKVETILSASTVSHQINTSSVERGNGIIRHMNARCNRKTLRFSKRRENHEGQIALSLAYYHLCLPHRSLTKRQGRLTTPFMAAGLANQVWTMGDLLNYRVPNPNS